MAARFVVHGLLLHRDYAQLPSRAEAKAWLGQGLRYGLAVALLTVVPTYVIYFAVQPMPGALVAKQIVFDGLALLVLGAVVASFYRDRQPA